MESIIYSQNSIFNLSEKYVQLKFKILIFIILFFISIPEISISQPYECGKKRYCREMSSCEEAMFYFRNCGLAHLDGDGDGVPCENLCRNTYKNYSSASSHESKFSRKELKLYIFLFALLISIIYLFFKFLFKKIFKKNEKTYKKTIEAKKNYQSVDDYLNLNNSYIVRNNIKFFHDKHEIFIDHAVISEYGIFLIKVFKLDGWIFGKEEDNFWTQVLFKIKKRIENPIPEMKEVVKFLSKELEIDHNLIHPIIFFSGDVEFKTYLPKNVINRELEKYIMSFNKKVFDKDKVNDILLKLSKYW